jgi:hypothetical protein
MNTISFKPQSSGIRKISFKDITPPGLGNFRYAEYVYPLGLPEICPSGTLEIK